MAEPFLSEIRMFSFNFPPRGWALCNGQLLPINQNQALFALLGTTYGGNGQTNFALPNLRGSVPIHAGAGHTLGEQAGSDMHTLSINQIPQHRHGVHGTAAAASAVSPEGALFAVTDHQTFGAAYAPLDSAAALAPQAISSTGGGQPHENRQPYLVLNFCIALQGIFPSRN
jgi:microcystin-dependent protein